MTTPDMSDVYDVVEVSLSVCHVFQFVCVGGVNTLGEFVSSLLISGSFLLFYSPLFPGCAGQ